MFHGGLLCHSSFEAVSLDPWDAWFLCINTSHKSLEQCYWYFLCWLNVWGRKDHIVQNIVLYHESTKSLNSISILLIYFLIYIKILLCFIHFQHMDTVELANTKWKYDDKWVGILTCLSIQQIVRTDGTVGVTHWQEFVQPTGATPVNLEGA